MNACDFFIICNKKNPMSEKSRYTEEWNEIEIILLIHVHAHKYPIMPRGFLLPFPCI